MCLSFYQNQPGFDDYDEYDEEFDDFETQVRIENALM